MSNSLTPLSASVQTRGGHLSFAQAIKASPRGACLCLGPV